MPGMFTMSPEIQAYGANQNAPGEASLEPMFKQRFGEMAYQVLFSRFAELAPNVITFKVIECDPTAGSGVGVFIVAQDDKTFYIPVVLVDSRLKPLEMFYSKDLNVFLPLSAEWMDEVSKLSLSEMGNGGDMPPGAPTDVNIRNLVLPPTLSNGRVGYASDHAAGIQKMFQKMAASTTMGPPQFLNILKNSPKNALDGLKLAFQKRPVMLSKLAEAYGNNELIAAMREGYSKYDRGFKRGQALVKHASDYAGRIDVLTKTASKDDIRRVFGKDAGTAFSQIRQTGYAIKDTRYGIDKIAVDIEGAIRLTSPGPGACWMRLYTYDGPAKNYLVVPVRGRSESAHMSYFDYYERTGEKPATKNYLVVSSDAKEAWVSDTIVGDIISPDTDKGLKKSPIVKYLTSGDDLTVGAYGFLLNPAPQGLEATDLFRVKTVMDSDGVTRVTTEDGCTYILGEKDGALRGKMAFTQGADNNPVVFVPKAANFVKVLTAKTTKAVWDFKDEMRRVSRAVITDPLRFRAWLKNIFKSAGAVTAAVKSAGHNEWWVTNAPQALMLSDALAKVAADYHIGVADAVRVLSNAQRYGHCNTYVLDKTARHNLAGMLDKLSAEQPVQQEMSNDGQQAAMPPQAPMPGMEQQGAPPPEGDPAAAGMGAPPPPPQAAISPTDLAIGEALQQLQQQNQMALQQNQAQMGQLQQKMEIETQQNQQLVQVLQTIQQRSQALAGATNGQIPAGAEQSPQVAAQAIVPAPPPEEPPPAVMDSGELSPEIVQQQINPQFVEQASQLKDKGMLDVGAVAMLASAPVFQDIAATYLPQLEKAVDNLARVLLTLWMKEKSVRGSIGDEAFIQLEDKLRNLLKGLGDLVLKLNKSSHAQESNDADAQQQIPQAM